MIKESTWLRYLQKYDGLLWKISRKISGDLAIANIEDNRSDLEVSALESINGYCKKNSITIDQFEADNHIESKLFDQYTKTVLWNSKNKKGKILSKKMKFRAANKSLEMEIEGEKVFQLEDTKFGSDLATSSIFISELLNGSKGRYQISDNPILSDAVEAIIDDPTVLKDGNLNRTALKNKYNVGPRELQKLKDTLESI